MNPLDTDYGVTEAMIRCGGSFVQGLGRLYRQADPSNQAKLKVAFPEYFMWYAGISRDLETAARKGR